MSKNVDSKLKLFGRIQSIVEQEFFFVKLIIFRLENIFLFSTFTTENRRAVKLSGHKSSWPSRSPNLIYIFIDGCYHVIFCSELKNILKFLAKCFLLAWRPSLVIRKSPYDLSWSTLPQKSYFAFLLALRLSIFTTIFDIKVEYIVTRRSGTDML